MMKKLLLLISILSIYAISIAQVTVNINSGNPKFPFPQFLSYKHGSDSLGNLGTNNAPGVTHAEMEQRIRDAWQIFANGFNYTGVTVNTVKYIKGNIGCPYDCSEGDGYALLAAAYMADKTTFDGLWMRTHDIRMVKYPRYSDGVVPNANYAYGQNILADMSDVASDGSFDIALALLIAWHQWGDSMGINNSQGNPISYKQEALNVINGLVEIANMNRGNCNSVSGSIGLDGYVKGGNTWQELTNWASTKDTCPEFKGPASSYVDYVAPSYFKEFSAFLTAQQQPSKNINQFKRAEASSDWIIGEWIKKDPKNIPWGGNVAITANSPVITSFMDGEDFRTSWRTILNYVWHGNPSYSWNPVTHQTKDSANTYEYDAAVRYSSFLNNPQGSPWSNSCASLGGGPTITYNGISTLKTQYTPAGASSSQLTSNWAKATAAPAAIATQDFNLMGQIFRQCVIDWNGTAGYLTSTPQYFDGWFRLMGMLLTSGNLQAPADMVTKPNLKIYRSVDKTFALAQQQISYTLNYRNYGSEAASGVVITENVPTGFTFVSATNGGVYNSSSNTVTWNIGTVSAFTTGGLAATQGTVSYILKANDGTIGTFCPSASISCNNGFGSVSNEYPNNQTAVMERNCIDIVNPITKVKSSEIKFNTDSVTVVKTVTFDKNSDSTILYGGRPNVNLSFATSNQSASSSQLGLEVRLYNDADEAYIDYGNYRMLYFMNYAKNSWNLSNQIAEGGNAIDVKYSFNILTANSLNGKKWNQYAQIQFPANLATTTQFLSQYYGMSSSIHQGTTNPLRFVWSINAQDWSTINWTDSWSWDASAYQTSGGNYFPISPDFTESKTGKAVTKLHQHSCATASQTVQNVVIEEWDGYAWRRVFGKGPSTGIATTNVPIVETLGTGSRIDSLYSKTVLGISPVVQNNIVSVTLPTLSTGQTGTLKYRAKQKTTDWSSNISVDNGSIVTIETGEMIINKNVTIASLTIKPGAKLTINTGDTLVISGKLIIESNANGTGSLIDNGKLIVNDTTYVQQCVTIGRNWYLSSPVSNAKSSTFLPLLYGTTQLWEYNELNATWNAIYFGNTVLSSMNGYVAHVNGFYSDTTLTFKGNLNTGTQSLSGLSRTGKINSLRGFNLIGNPYPSCVNWESAIKNNLEPTIWYRTKNKNNEYVFDTYNADSHIGTNNNGNSAVSQYIPPMQAVWTRVYADDLTGEVIFNNSMRSHPNNNTLKSDIVIKNVRLNVTDGKNSDETILVFNEQASNGFDSYDSEKMFATNNDLPEIYTIADNEKLVINGLKQNDTCKVIPLGFKTTKSGEFSISASKITGLENVMVILEDKHLHNTQNLSLSPIYSFASDSVNDANRFVIHLKSGAETTAITIGTQSEISIYSVGNFAIISTSNDNANGIVTVFDVLGQIIASASLTGTKTEIELPIGAAAYFVKVETEKVVETKKIIIK